ncbi:XPG_N domain-containing protein/XPG_I domain-containing protein [Cephalotus follicularis]|uniref:Exonuclease 1 n=1 Tax=Cephalotus follicularis TaxID=3775 RepID=A0A1Q3BM93_CEPFO|nr:XPG_N domain-containing protein/XPG_I domain-containing protein [Cephalotus follicularis]
MGIKDLLRFMKPYIEPIHIRKYAGKRVGIDAYSWLHKGAYSCSMELCLNSDSSTKGRYLEYFMHRINLLRHYKITPVVVFDGGNLPSKAATENQRHRRRQANHELAMVKLNEGNVNAASELFQRAVSITPLMAHQLIQILRSENVEFVVAPYEADAQLAYLCSLEPEKGGTVAVITEDSDLMAYGCQATVFKMDRYGNGEEVLLDKVFISGVTKPSFRNFDKELFIGMCVLAGCDFLPSIPGIGIAKAYSFVSKYRNIDRVLSVLKLKKGNQIPEDYNKSFREALAVFQHARIYDADSKELKHLKPLTPKNLESLEVQLDFLGPEIPSSIATAIAEGNLDPINMEAFDRVPSFKSEPDPVVMQTSDRFLKSETAVASVEKSGFLVISSKKIREKELQGTVTKQNLVFTERKYFNEAVGLHKLVLPSYANGTMENTVFADDIPLQVPNNNPFKRRKVDEMNEEQIMSTTERIIAASDDEKLDALCITPDNALPKVPDNYISRKRRRSEIHLNQIEESIMEQVSVVTEVENSDVSCVAVESQESINSKPKEVSGRKGLSKKLKSGSHCKSSVNKKSTILNFFSRD